MPDEPSTGWGTGFADSVILLFAAEIVLESRRVSGLRRAASGVLAGGLLVIVLLHLNSVFSFGVLLLGAFGFGLRRRDAGSGPGPGPA